MQKNNNNNDRFMLDHGTKIIFQFRIRELYTYIKKNHTTDINYTQQVIHNLSFASDSIKV